MNQWVHGKLSCGIEYGVIPLPERHVVSFQIMVLAGSCCEPQDKLGLARILVETIDKGTEQRSGRELSDAFDAIGAMHGSGSGRETTTFSCTVLPEHFAAAMKLHAEFLRRPTFPTDMFENNVELGRQEILALQDDAQGLLDKHISHRAYGPLLGRHPLGEAETLDTLAEADLRDYWKKHFHAGRMIVSVAGAVSPSEVADVLESEFSGFGPALAEGRDPWEPTFEPGTEHFDKDLEQEQISICWPSLQVGHDDFPVQQVILGVLSGGMSGRLFTEVREKQGLVYWVGAWQETPRGTGRIFLGASTTVERRNQTHTTLLREVDRLAEDLEQEELDRAVTGLVASTETRGDMTRTRCSSLAGDLFHRGHPVSTEEKVRRVQAVTLEDIRRYLREYPRGELLTMTLGPEPLGEARE